MPRPGRDDHPVPRRVGFRGPQRGDPAGWSRPTRRSPTRPGPGPAGPPGPLRPHRSGLGGRRASSSRGRGVQQLEGRPGADLPAVRVDQLSAPAVRESRGGPGPRGGAIAAAHFRILAPDAVRQAAGGGRRPHTWTTVMRCAFGRPGSSNQPAQVVRGRWSAARPGALRSRAVAATTASTAAAVARKAGQPPGARRRGGRVSGLTGTRVMRDSTRCTGASRGPPRSTSVRVTALATSPGAAGEGGLQVALAPVESPAASLTSPSLSRTSVPPTATRHPARPPAPPARFSGGTGPCSAASTLPTVQRADPLRVAERSASVTYWLNLPRPARRWTADVRSIRRSRHGPCALSQLVRPARVPGRRCLLGHPART